MEDSDVASAVFTIAPAYVPPQPSTPPPPRVQPSVSPNSPSVSTKSGGHASGQTAQAAQRSSALGSRVEAKVVTPSAPVVTKQEVPRTASKSQSAAPPTSGAQAHDTSHTNAHVAGTPQAAASSTSSVSKPAPETPPPHTSAHTVIHEQAPVGTVEHSIGAEMNTVHTVPAHEVRESETNTVYSAPVREVGEPVSAKGHDSGAPRGPRDAVSVHILYVCVNAFACIYIYIYMCVCVCVYTHRKMKGLPGGSHDGESVYVYSVYVLYTQTHLQ
jgi:hypothetical protein